MGILCPMALVEIRGLSLVYPDGTEALTDVDLSIERDELVALVGPSGSGKTTLLRLIAGLEKPTSGEISIDGRSLAGVPVRDRGVSMVFQEDTLYGHLTVGKNVEFPLAAGGIEREERRERVGNQAARFGIVPLLRRRPRELAAGHRQAATAARATIRDVPVLLLDEPLARLDAKGRRRIRAEIAKMREGRTVIYVTNDQEEAMALSDRIAVLAAGRLHQVGEPDTLYHHPTNMFVAGFIGSPPMNLLPARWEEGRLHLGDARLPMGHRPELDGYTNVIAGLRPEDVRPAAPSDPYEQCLTGRVVALENLGELAFAHLSFGNPDSGSLDFIVRLTDAKGVGPGRDLELAVDVDRLRFFDPATGNAIRRLPERAGA